MRRYLSLLRNRPFATLWAGSTVSAFGDSMTWVALVWLAFERGGADTVSALVVVATAPLLVGGLASGLVLDRFDRRKVLVAVNLTLGVAVAAVPLWGLLDGSPPTWVLLAVAALYGFLRIANLAGVPALIPALVQRQGPEHGQRDGVDRLRDRGRRGPGGRRRADRRGLRRARARPGRPHYAVFLGYLLGLRGRLPRSAGEEEAEPGLRPAVRFLRRTPLVLATTLMFMAFNIGEGMLLVLLPVYASSVLAGGAGTYGLLVSAFSLAALTGSLVVGAVDWGRPLGRSIAVVQTLAGASFLVLALEPGLTGTIAALFVAGLLVSPLTILAQTLRMRLIPEALRGRAFGLLRTLMQATPPLGGAVAGLLLAGPGIAATAITMSVVMAVPGLIGLVSPALAEPGARRSRRAPRRLGRARARES